MKSERHNNSDKGNKLDFDEFKKRLQAVTCATSIEETSIYSNLRFKGDTIQGIRFQTCFKKSDFSINLKKLHEAYCDQDSAGLNTVDLRKYVNGKQAPALAILLAAGLTKYKKRK